MSEASLHEHCTFVEMYYSRAKRLMAKRLLSVSTFLLTILALFYTSLWLRRSVCTWSLISWLPICPKVSQGSQWNLFHHLGGNGPWIARHTSQDDVLNPLPLGCEVDQVHMLSRHAERYPTLKAGQRHLQLLERLQAPDIKLGGPLEFLNTWSYFASNASLLEGLTDTGPYSGVRQSFRTGQKLHERYGNLVNPNKSTNIWTCSSGRDLETAEHFILGFFGESHRESNSATLHMIPEDISRGANTLTPGDTCVKYINDPVEGHDKGYGELAKWQDRFTVPIARRLKSFASELTFSALEIYSMMEMCGFEILVRGKSPWCDVFSHEEWLDFEYARDLLHFYRAGPGNKYAGTMGWLWLNATTTILAHDPKDKEEPQNKDDDISRGVYFSFVHDGDLIPVLATLGILDEKPNREKVKYLPSDYRKDKRKWKTSTVVPMSGRLIFERVTCDNTGLGYNLRRRYVRLWINDGIVDLERELGLGSGGGTAGGLQMGLGMESWKRIIKQKREKFGEFGEVCGLDKDVPWDLDFLRPQGEG